MFSYHKDKYFSAEDIIEQCTDDNGILDRGCVEFTTSNKHTQESNLLSCQSGVSKLFSHPSKDCIASIQTSDQEVFATCEGMRSNLNFFAHKQLSVKIFENTISKPSLFTRCDYTKVIFFNENLTCIQTALVLDHAMKITLKS